MGNLIRGTRHLAETRKVGEGAFWKKVVLTSGLAARMILSRGHREPRRQSLLVSPPDSVHRPRPEAGGGQKSDLPSGKRIRLRFYTVSTCRICV